MNQLIWDYEISEFFPIVTLSQEYKHDSNYRKSNSHFKYQHLLQISGLLLTVWRHLFFITCLIETKVNAVLLVWVFWFYARQCNTNLSWCNNLTPKNILPLISALASISVTSSFFSCRMLPYKKVFSRSLSNCWS